MTTCPTCAEEAKAIFRDLETKLTVLLEQVESVRTLLSARPGESVVEAVKRWRETMEWYGNMNHYYSTSGKTSRIAEDCGQRARAVLLPDLNTKGEK